MLRKRGTTYQIDLHTNGLRIRKSAGTSDRQKAQEYHDKLAHDLWRQSRLEEKPKRTWQEAVVRWLKEHEHKKSIDKDKQRLKILDQWFRGVLLSDIDRNLVDRAKEEKRNEKLRKEQGEVMSMPLV